MKKSEYVTACERKARGDTPKGGWGRVFDNRIYPSKLTRRIERISKFRDKQHQVRGGGL